MKNIFNTNIERPTRRKMLYDLFTIITLIFFAKDLIGVFKGGVSNIYILVVLGGVYIILLALNENIPYPKLQVWLFLIGAAVLLGGLIVNMYNILTSESYLQTLHYPTVSIYTIYVLISSRYIKKTLDDKKAKIKEDKKIELNKNKPKKKKKKK